MQLYCYCYCYCNRCRCRCSSETCTDMHYQEEHPARGVIIIMLEDASAPVCVDCHDVGVILILPHWQSQVTCLTGAERPRRRTHRLPSKGVALAAACMARCGVRGIRKCDTHTAMAQTRGNGTHKRTHDQCGHVCTHTPAARCGKHARARNRLRPHRPCGLWPLPPGPSEARHALLLGQLHSPRPRPGFGVCGGAFADESARMSGLGGGKGVGRGGRLGGGEEERLSPSPPQRHTRSRGTVTVVASHLGQVILVQPTTHTYPAVPLNSSAGGGVNSDRRSALTQWHQSCTFASIDRPQPLDCLKDLWRAGEIVGPWGRWWRQSR